MVRDPGLQPERTAFALAWSRTALAMLARALVLLRSGLADEPSSLAACGGLLLVGAGWLQAVAVVRRRRLCEARQALAGPMPATVPVPVIMGTALLTAACSGGALVAIILTMN